MKKNKERDSIVPKQSDGKAITAKEIVELRNEREAKEFFEVAKNRLRNVNSWAELAGNGSATFQLMDSSGIPIDRYVEKGDLVRIDIPGPGSQAGEGYDWVQIEAIEFQSTPYRNHYSFRVRPTQNPSKKKEGIAHFYSKESTSTFMVKQNKNTVSVAIYDRNTKPNVNAESSMNNVRDAIVGTAGILGFSKFQWTKLIHGILKKENEQTFSKYLSFINDVKLESFFW